jgi:hypothetical protein
VDISEAFRRQRACYPRTRLFVIMDNLRSVHDHPRFLALLHQLRSEPVWTPTEASWLNSIDAQFGVLKRFTLTNTGDPCHRARRVSTLSAQHGPDEQVVGPLGPGDARAARRRAAGVWPAPEGSGDTRPEHPLLRQKSLERRIPKTIIQTGPHRALPLLHRAVVANIRLLNPDFEYRFFDNDDVDKFVTQEFPQYRPTFDAFRFPIQRYDFFRYLAIYRYGGFYLDLDVLLATNLSPLVDLGCVFPFDDLGISQFLRRTLGMDWTIGNYAFGAMPGHPFLWAVIQSCIRGQEHPEWIEPALRGIPRPFRDDFLVLNSTGPLLVSRALGENKALAEDVAILFPEDVRDPASWHRFGRFGIHLMEGSWRPKEKLLRKRLRTLWESWVFRRLMKDSAKLGATRDVRRAVE